VSRLGHRSALSRVMKDRRGRFRLSTKQRQPASCNRLTHDGPAPPGSAEYGGSSARGAPPHDGAPVPRCAGRGDNRSLTSPPTAPSSAASACQSRDRRLLFRLPVGGVSRRPTGRLTWTPGSPSRSPAGRRRSAASTQTSWRAEGKRGGGCWTWVVASACLPAGPAESAGLPGRSCARARAERPPRDGRQAPGTGAPDDSSVEGRPRPLPRGPLGIPCERLAAP
jgi:hypothetical protein